MTLTRGRQVQIVIVLVTAIAVLQVYQRATQKGPRAMPLTYTRGMTVSSPVRRGPPVAGAKADPLTVFLERKIEPYPGVKRDLFRFSGDGTVLRPKPKPVVVTQPVVTAPVLPAVPQKSPEEIAAEKARADLSTFRFLGYLTDKDSSLFLSKDGELFIAKSGDRLLENYLIKSADKDHVVLMDTVTKVEVRIELTGSGGAAAR
jgi:hypothetical protein